MKLQGRQDLNLQPAVLETAALPIELRPYALRYSDFSHYQPLGRNGEIGCSVAGGHPRVENKNSRIG